MEGLLSTGPTLSSLQYKVVKQNNGDFSINHLTNDQDSLFQNTFSPCVRWSPNGKEKRVMKMTFFVLKVMEKVKVTVLHVGLGLAQAIFYVLKIIQYI